MELTQENMNFMIDAFKSSCDDFVKLSKEILRLRKENHELSERLMNLKGGVHYDATEALKALDDNSPTMARRHISGICDKTVNFNSILP